MAWVKIELTEDQMRWAYQVGGDRHIHCVLTKTKPRYGCPAEIAWQANIEGALGELALSIHTGVPWNPTIDVVGAPDVGPYEVRSTYDGASLITHHRDKGTKPYVLARVGDLPIVKLCGWMWGAESKNPEAWRDQGLREGGSAYFNHHRTLRPMDDLPSPKELAWMPPA